MNHGRMVGVGLFGGRDGEEDVRGDLAQVRNLSNEDREMGRDDGVDSDGELWPDNAILCNRGIEN